MSRIQTNQAITLNRSKLQEHVTILIWEQASIIDLQVQTMGKIFQPVKSGGMQLAATYFGACVAAGFESPIRTVKHTQNPTMADKYTTMWIDENYFAV
ncbi:hypothetical protein SDJN03_14954, partial [Cucurbita argyrosperma subsp. sororia]